MIATYLIGGLVGFAIGIVVQRGLGLILEHRDGRRCLSAATNRASLVFRWGLFRCFWSWGN